MTDMNILDLFLKASLLVKLIMLILIGFSIASWAIIIQRTRILNSAAREAEAFEDKFWWDRAVPFVPGEPGASR